MKRAEIIAELGAALVRRGWYLVCAESCTGGGIAAALTEVAGSSAWFDRGFVTYSNRAKREMLGVSAQTLEQQGAVSRETVLQMAAGALAHSSARLAVAVSGIAGPGGGSPDKPVGTVWIAWAGPDGAQALHNHFPGDRHAVREATIDAALRGLLERAR
jgi:nicotinamide-nucleotide amidase